MRIIFRGCENSTLNFSAEYCKLNCKFTCSFSKIKIHSSIYEKPYFPEKKLFLKLIKKCNQDKSKSDTILRLEISMTNN